MVCAFFRIRIARRLITLAAFLFLFHMAYSSLWSSQADSINVSGKWDVTVQSPEGTATPTITLAQNGEKITGTYMGKMGKAGLEGTLKGKDIKFVVVLKFQGQPINVTYSGTVEGDAMKGTVRFSSGGSGTWSARLQKKS